MRKLVFTLLALVVVGGAAYFLQQQGVLARLAPALASLTGSKGAPQEAKNDGGKNPQQRRQAGPSPVEIVAAKRMTISDDITAIGSLVSDESVQISAETSGRVSDIHFQEGDNVKAGDVLFKLD